MAKQKKLKPYLLSANKVKRVQRYLKAETEEAAIEEALDVLIDRKRLTLAGQK